MLTTSDNKSSWSDWVEKIGAAASLIGIGGLLVLIAHSANAETPNMPPPSPPPGFEGGNKAFNNPFAPPSGGADTFFEDEGDTGDELIFPEDNAGNVPPPSGDSLSSGGSAGGDYRASGISAGGSSAVVSKPNQPKPLKVDTETAEGCKDVVTEFNFPDADIMDIAKTLGRLTGKNFILDSKDVKGRITIISNGPITCGDAWKAFLTALDVNGFALIPSGNYIRIARQRDARDKQLKTYTGDYSPDTDALITRVFPLKYLSAEEVARNFRSFMPANSRIIPYEQTNTVIVTDTGSNIAKLQRLLEILDVEGYDAGIEVIPVQYASATELAKLVDQLIPGTPQGGPPGAPRFGSQGRFASRRTKEGGIINTILADERTNKLIVHANSKGTEQIRELISKLDSRQAANTGGGRVHVIYLQFADAEAISTTINNLSQQSNAPRPVIPGGTGINPTSQALFEGSIRVSPDKATNSLVITASPGDFVTIQRVINRLDIPRDQVYAEAVIMEVTLGKNFNFSSNIINPKNGIGLITNQDDILGFATNPLSQKGAIISFAGGGTTKMKVGDKDVPVGSITALIKAIQTNSNANILATPQIMTLDNTEATFETTEKIPIPTTTAVQGAGVTKSITKENISLSLKIKPQINKISNFVKMDITANLEDINNRALPAEVKDAAFATISRRAQTSVVVADSDTVVMGGLTRDNQQDTVNKIPILGDIPLLGWLFRSKESASAKTNMLIFITPRIIRQYESVRAVLDKKLKERDDFLESNTGGEDRMRTYRDQMIRDLPDIKSIVERKVNRSADIDMDDTGPVEPAQPSPGADAAPAVPSPAAPIDGSPAPGGNG